MKISKSTHNRLSIEISSEMHRLIKINAAFHNQSIKEYVLTAIKKYLRKEMDNKALSIIIREVSPSLKDAWNNKKDADYDKL